MGPTHPHQVDLGRGVSEKVKAGSSHEGCGLWLWILMVLDFDGNGGGDGDDGGRCVESENREISGFVDLEVWKVVALNE